MSRNRRGHRGGRKHHHHGNGGSPNTPRHDKCPQVYTPGPFTRESSDTISNKKRSSWSFLKFVYNCWFVLIRSCAFLPVFIAFELGMLVITITGCRKGGDEFLGLSEFWDAVGPKPY